MQFQLSSGIKSKTYSFLWQHFLLIISLFIMTLGVALCVRSALGSSVISTIPLVMSLAGTDNLAPQLTIGEYTYIMNFLLVGLQLLILRRRFDPMQLFQLVIGFLFGFLLDINMLLTSSIVCETLTYKIITQLLGCLVLAFGISLEIRCGSVTMPGEGITVAISKACNIPFPKAKIYVDISMVIVAVALSFLFFHTWLWNAVGIGTLIAMLFVGMAVRWIDPYNEWFTRLLYYRPDFQFSIFGLAKYLRRKQ